MSPDPEEALPARHRTFIAIIGDQEAMTRPMRVDESLDAIGSQWSERAVTFGDACMPVPIRLHIDGQPCLVNPAAIASVWTETPASKADDSDIPF